MSSVICRREDITLVLRRRVVSGAGLPGRSPRNQMHSQLARPDEEQFAGHWITLSCMKAAHTGPRMRVAGLRGGVVLLFLVGLPGRLAVGKVAGLQAV